MTSRGPSSSTRSWSRRLIPDRQPPHLMRAPLGLPRPDCSLAAPQTRISTSPNTRSTAVTAVRDSLWRLGADFLGGMAVDEHEGAIYAGGTTESNDLPSIGYRFMAARRIATYSWRNSPSTDPPSCSPLMSEPETTTRSTGWRSATTCYVSIGLGFIESYLPTTPANSSGEFVGRFRRDGTLLRLQKMPGQAAVALGPDRTPYIAATVFGGGLATAGAFQTTPGNSSCFVQFRVTGPCSDVLVAHYSIDLSARFWATYLRETTAQAGNAVDSVRALPSTPPARWSSPARRSARRFR